MFTFSYETISIGGPLGAEGAAAAPPGDGRLGPTAAGRDGGEIGTFAPKNPPPPPPDLGGFKFEPPADAA